MFLFLQHLLVNSSIVVSSPPLPPPSPSLDIKAEKKKNRYLYKIPMPCSTLSSKMWPADEKPKKCKQVKKEVACSTLAKNKRCRREGCPGQVAFKS
ncbi:hypothetical protein B0T18DRAFT_421941 [Schizothecium vesticola]|uniref:Secreted protein n=1 Tax=Schizothecium vesticola TaxID=314040 RepID=A0AA40EHK6_9PEZI|nr:hypothetical protein B0T18DRAFT_421941 [Schizothecium vesticola]